MENALDDDEELPLAFDTNEELRAALERRIEHAVSNSDWQIVEAELLERDSHPPFGMGDMEEALAIYRSGVPSAVTKEAARLRLKLCGTAAPGMLSQLLNASAMSALDQAFWMITGRPTPDPDQPRDASLQGLLGRRGLLVYPVLIAIAAEVLAQRHHVSHHVALCALFGDKPMPGARTSSTWPIDLMVTPAVSAAIKSLGDVAATRPGERFRAAVEAVEAEDPDATWRRRFEVYEARYADAVGRTFDNQDAFKKAAQRAVRKARD